MDAEKSYMIIVTDESSKKRKLQLQAEESDLFPLPKHFCLDQQASLSDSSSDIDFAESSYAMEETKVRDEVSSGSVTCASFSTRSLSSSSGSTISSIEQYCSKVKDKTQEDIEDFMEFICPEFVVEDLQGEMNPARWSVKNQDSEETTRKPTIDQEFEDYFSTLLM